MREEDATRVNRFISEIREWEKELEPPDHDELGLGDRVEFSETETRQLNDLYEKRWVKLCSVVECIASELGRGNIAGLDDGTLREVLQDALDAIDNWGGEAEMQMPPAGAKTPLQRLLADHHELGVQILDIQDEVLDRDRAKLEGYPEIDRDDA